MKFLVPFFTNLKVNHMSLSMILGTLIFLEMVRSGMTHGRIKTIGATFMVGMIHNKRLK